MATPENDTFFSLIRPQPDRTTSEAIAYGSAFEFALGSAFIWDQMAKFQRDEEENVKAKIIDPVFACKVMSEDRYMLSSSMLPFNDTGKYQDVCTLNEAVAIGTSIETIQTWKLNNQLYAMMKGAREHADQLRAMGISDAMWSAATAGWTQPVEYATIAKLEQRRTQAARRYSTRARPYYLDPDGRTPEDMEDAEEEYSEDMEDFKKRRLPRLIRRGGDEEPPEEETIPAEEEVPKAPKEPALELNIMRVDTVMGAAIHALVFGAPEELAEIGRAATKRRGVFV